MSEEIPEIKVSNTTKKKLIVPFRMDEEMSAKVTAYMNAHGLKVKSRAIRELILKGLG